jgi:hypothetical protein
MQYRCSKCYNIYDPSKQAVSCPHKVLVVIPIVPQRAMKLPGAAKPRISYPIKTEVMDITSKPVRVGDVVAVFGGDLGLGVVKAISQRSVIVYSVRVSLDGSVVTAESIVESPSTQLCIVPRERFHDSSVLHNTVRELSRGLTKVEE